MADEQASVSSSDFSSSSSEFDSDTADYEITEPSWDTTKWFSFKPTGTPSIRSAFNVVATMVGAGVLSLPFAVKRSGWSGIFILIAVAFMANYTGKILIKAMYAKKPATKLHTYHEIGRAAFGPKGGLLTLFFQYATLFSVGTLFLLLAGLNEQQLAKSWWKEIDVKYFIAASTLVVAPVVLGLKTMKEISWIAALGMLAASFLVVVVIIIGFLYPDHNVKRTWVNVQEYPYAFATFVFSFGGHAVFPTIQDTMRSTKNFNRMFNWSFIAVMALYLPPAIIGYYAFGEQVKSPILLNLRNGALTYMANIAITIHVLIVIPIVVNPISLALESRFKVNESRLAVVWRSLIRIGLLLVEGGLAVLVPHFADFMAFIGATCVTAIVFFIPTLIHLRMRGFKLPVWELIWASVVLLTATIGSVIGTYQSLIQLYKDLFLSAADQTKTIVPKYVFYIVLMNVVALTLGALIFMVTYILVKRNQMGGREALKDTKPNVYETIEKRKF